jgi:hypothetical protein
MKQLLWFLVVACCAVSAAAAGPNAGGVLWVHDTGILYSGDTVKPIVSTPPDDCAGVDNQQPLDGVKRVWKVYAAFPPGSNPRLKGTAWAIEFPVAPADPYILIEPAGSGVPDADGPGTDFVLLSFDFPTASGGEIGQSFPFPRLTTVVELYYFTGYASSGTGASTPVTFDLVESSSAVNRFFVDDVTPQNTDPIMGYGSLGFGQPGTTPCPTSDPDAACCALAGTCTITKRAACAAPSSWHAEWYTCTPNPCPAPTGACCYGDGRCQTTLMGQCSNGGGVYQGDFVPCDPTPCPEVAACCLPSGSCLIRNQAACVALNPPGLWYAGTSSCTPDPCSSLPSGSCCLPSGSCTVGTETACTEGIWTLSGGCVPNICPAPNEPRACCTLQRTCTLTLRGDCIEPSQWHPEWSSCDPNLCPTPVGACCTLNGVCTLTMESNCDPSSTWRGDFTDCEPNPCPGLPTESTSWGHIKNRYH